MTQNPAKPLLISFSGIDGAGKTTQISLLQDALTREGLRHELVTFWDDVVTLKSLREQSAHKILSGDQGVGSPDRPISRRDKNVQSPLLTAARLFFYFLDTLSLRSTVAKTRKAKTPAGTNVVIFDRYIYDELANLSGAHMFSRLYTSLILGMAPRPDLALVVDADPNAAFARKPEYPLEFLHTNRNAYLNLAKRAGMTVIAPAAIPQAHAEIMRHVWEKRNALPPG